MAGEEESTFNLITDEMVQGMEAIYDEAAARSDDEEPAPVESIEAPETEETSESPDADAGAEEAAPVAEGDTAVGTGEEAGDTGETPQSITPPESWTAEDKEVFATLPPVAQEAILKRESERESYLTQKSQELSDKGKTYEGVESAISHRRSKWAASGMDDGQAIETAFQVAENAFQKPEEFIGNLAQGRKIDLLELAIRDLPQDARAEIMQYAGQYRENYQFTEPVDPALDKRLQFIETTVGNLANQTEQEKLNEAQRLWDDFQAEKDAQGNPKHPHIEAVRDDMKLLIDNGRATNYHDAYETAIFLKKDLREKVVQQQIIETDAERVAREKAEAEKAKKTMGTVIREEGTPEGARGGDKLPWDKAISTAAISDIYDKAASR